MRGHIVKRYKNSDSYSIVINLGVDPATGKRKQQWISVKGTKKDAEKKLAELLHQIDTGSFVTPKRITMSEYLEQWLRDYCVPNLAPRTTEGYQYIVRTHLIPTLGQIPLMQLKPEHLQQMYYNKLTSGRSDGKGGLSNRSVRYCHVTLHKALQNALKMGMIMRNPADAVEPPKVHRREMQTMNESDIHLFLEMARSTQYYTIFYVLIFTGLRRSEILALRWSDVDLLLCQLSVNRTIHQLHNGQIIFGEAKTQKSRRLIALSPSTVAVLKEHRETQEGQRRSIGLSLLDDDLIFCQENGKPLLPDSITHAWMRLARSIGLKGIRLHDARHTHASLMLKQGIHPKIVQERLGHSSIQVTLDTYSHVAPGLQQAAANRFDDIVLPRKASECKTEALADFR
jgi:integrase